jgi:hypothetical protein
MIEVDIGDPSSSRSLSQQQRQQQHQLPKQVEAAISFLDGIIHDDISLTTSYEQMENFHSSPEHFSY